MDLSALRSNVNIVKSFWDRAPRIQEQTGSQGNVKQSNRIDTDNKKLRY